MTLPFPVGHDALWRYHAACSAHLQLHLLGLTATVEFDSDLWFPAKAVPGYEAKRICAGCPVRVDCLQGALLDSEEHGIWGGAGENLRRLLARLLRVSPHPDRVIVDGCDCRFHRALADHWRRLDEFARTGVMPRGQIITYGPGATHGRKSTYTRGCRGDGCMVAMGLKPTGVPCPGDEAAKGEVS